VTLSINDTLHSNTLFEYDYAQCHVSLDMLNVVMLNAVMLIVVALVRKPKFRDGLWPCLRM